MKIFLSISSLILLVSLSALASSAPFGPELEDRLIAIESNFPSTGYAVDGLLTKRVARVTYDVAEHGGSSTAHALGVTLPAGAIIQRDLIYFNTAFTDAGAGTVALSCGTANNILSAVDITGNVGTILEGVSTGASTVMKNIASACEITATVGVVPQLTGKLTLFVEYLLR